VDLRHVKAVLLDMDGTLVDSDAVVERAWVTWAGAYGVRRGRSTGCPPGIGRWR
jgi:beta-phosphoglucomutase-like phosphatase (HAD superfamily)